jgi:hypothetical protein
MVEQYIKFLEATPSNQKEQFFMAIQAIVNNTFTNYDIKKLI